MCEPNVHYPATSEDDFFMFEFSIGRLLDDKSILSSSLVD